MYASHLEHSKHLLPYLVDRVGSITTVQVDHNVQLTRTIAKICNITIILYDMNEGSQFSLSVSNLWGTVRGPLQHALKGEYLVLACLGKPMGYVSINKRKVLTITALKSRSGM